MTSDRGGALLVHGGRGDGGPTAHALIMERAARELEARQQRAAALRHEKARMREEVSRQSAEHALRTRERAARAPADEAGALHAGARA